MKNVRTLSQLAITHHQVPEYKPKTRHIGIIISILAWFLYSLFTLLIDKLNPHFHIATKTLSKTFFEFAIMHLAMLIFYLPCCLIFGGIKYLRAVEPRLIMWRSIAAVLSFWFYSFSRIWTSTIDNSLLYSTDALWVVIILWYLKQNISFIATSGIVISFIGIGFVYFLDSRSIYDLFGGLFGVGAGITLAIITVITSYLVKQDPPIRIGLYQGTLGFSTCFIISMIFGSIHGFDFPNFHEILSSFVTGIIFSALLYLIWKAFCYTEAYFLGALSYILPIFLIFAGWLIGEEPMNNATMIGTVIISLGAALAIWDSFKNTKHH